MIKKSTYTLALEACESFFTETGQVPTIEAIKPLIGVNSPSTISSAIKDWKAKLANTVRADQGALPGVPAALQDAIQHCWQLALAESRQVFNDKVEELQTQQAFLSEQETALKKESERVYQLLQLADLAYQEKLAQLSQENSSVTAENRRLSEQSEYDRTRAIELEKTNAVLNETVRQEQDKVRRLEHQYDKEHDWALMRIEEEKDSHRQKTQNEMARLQSAAERSQQDAELLQSKYSLLAKKKEETNSRVMELESLLANEKVQKAELTLQAALYQQVINEKDSQIRSLKSQPKNQLKQSKNQKNKQSS